MQIKVYIKKHIAILICLTLFGAGLILQVICSCIGSNILDQNVAPKYGQNVEYTQLTLFTSGVSGFSGNDITKLRAGIQKSINENVFANDLLGRTFIDSYTAIDKLDFTSQKSAATIQTYAVGGDFFVFHPMTLVSGSYFSEESDENADGIVLNELAAWELFGATDIAGMRIDIDDVSMPVRGVVKDPDSKLAEASGEIMPRAYLEYNKYIEFVDINNTNSEELKGVSAICCYEALIINPVKDFAINTVKDLVELDEYTYEYVINSERFSIKNRLLLIKDFFNRVMNKTGVVYPYWENYARAKEQVIMLLTMLEIILFLASLVFLIMGIISLKSEYLKVKSIIRDKKEQLNEFIKAKTRRTDKVEEKSGRESIRDKT